MSKGNRGEAICETVSELKFIEKLRRLDEERQRKERHKKSPSAATEQAKEKISIYNDSTNEGICQGGGASSD